MVESHKYKLAEIFQNGMLFQRDKEIHLWGSAAPGAIVNVSLYEAAKTPECGTGGLKKDGPIRCGEGVADQDGQFRIVLAPMPAGEGYCLDVLFDGVPEISIRLKDIGFGDIWLAGGQSNMEFFLKYDRDWEKTKRLPRNPHIRMYNVPQRAFDGHSTHNKTGYGYWFDDSDPALACFSAPGYSFARQIQEALGVPVGVIGCNWGGSTAAAWVPEEVLSAPPLDAYLREYEEAVSGISSEKLKADSLAAWAFEDSAAHCADFEPLLYGRDRDWQLHYMKVHAGDPVIPMGPYNMNRPAGLYHTMLSTLIPFSIKGVLWYQGESDAGDRAVMYDKLLTGLIGCWRRAWNDDFPFLIVQLAPFGVWLDCDNKGYALVREKQAAVAESVPDVYMAGIMDLGSYYDIHPKEKMEVGRRLALLARGHVYGEKELLCDAPKAVKAVRLNDRQIAVTFMHGEGLTGKSDFPTAEALPAEAAGGKEKQTAGEEYSAWHIKMQNRNVVPAEADAEDSRVILTLPDDIQGNETPSYVSLGCKDYAEIRLFNRAGLSATPFKLEIEEGDIL